MTIPLFNSPGKNHPTALLLSSPSTAKLYTHTVKKEQKAAKALSVLFQKEDKKNG